MCNPVMPADWQCIDGHNWNRVSVPAGTSAPPVKCKKAPAGNYLPLYRAEHPGLGYRYAVTVGVLPTGNSVLFQCECGFNGKFRISKGDTDAALDRARRYAEEHQALMVARYESDLRRIVRADGLAL